METTIVDVLAYWKGLGLPTRHVMYDRYVRVRTSWTEKGVHDVPLTLTSAHGLCPPGRPQLVVRQRVPHGLARHVAGLQGRR